MQIESGKGTALRHHLRRAAERCHQRLQRFLDFENHLRAARRDQRHITAELDAIAQALLAVNQDSLAGDRVPAVPGGLRKIPLHRDDRVLLPAPLVVRPAALEVAGQQPQRGRVAMGHDVPGPQSQGAVIACQRFLISLQLPQDLAAIVVRIGMIWAQRNGAIVARQRFLVALQRLQSVTAVVQRVGIVRPQG